jgi:hypothetical protein
MVQKLELKMRLGKKREELILLTHEFAHLGKKFDALFGAVK